MANSRRGHTILLSLILAFTVLYLLRDDVRDSHSPTPMYAFADTSKSYEDPFSGSADYSIEPQDALPSSDLESFRQPPEFLPHEPESVVPVSSYHSVPETSLHLLVPASESNAGLCRTLLSAALLDYPTLTLINWNQTFKSEDWSHVAKIKAVYQHLQSSDINDDDLVLIVDGYDVWFQLPMQVMVKQYRNLVEEANARLAKKYGFSGSDAGVQRYTSSIFFGAEKGCWSNANADLACTAVPESPLPADVYGKDLTDKVDYRTRPKWINSGTIMGPAADLRALYQAAVEVSQKINDHMWSDQYVFNQLFGDQEYARGLQQNSSPEDWRHWFGSLLYSQPSKNETPLMVLDPNKNYEYHIGLDYTKILYQTMTHNTDGEIDFLDYSNSSQLRSVERPHQSHAIALPDALLSSPGPFAMHATLSVREDSSSDRIVTSYLDHNDTLDILPPIDTLWRSSLVPLATNTYFPSVPSLLHMNGEDSKALMDEYWKKMWFQPYARALLRQHMRHLLSVEDAAVTPQQRTGGKGGVWTDQQTWMPWPEICAGTEDELFGDGKGAWTKEGENGGLVRNYFGLLLSGAQEDEEEKQKWTDDEAENAEAQTRDE
ncbi:hypothetical protein LTS18_011839 [Coniosporium uncinatum]|uniref:Uncharacterized protein n=1 Tax=Coniosporium uncinatum TaxID=93489 RepID=A0ACC3D9K7_9PEZI|nr:hypothetical protein LTS18_011839 [Coniosporium uncinatum]